MFTRPAITLPEVNGFGWNLGYSEYIVWSWPWQILGAIRAEVRAGERAEILFFLSCKQCTTLPISVQPNFTKFAHKTWIWEIVNPSGKHFWKFACKGSFLPKRSSFVWTSSTTFEFRPRYLRNDYKSWKVTTGFRAYEMLTFHLYHWNQLKVIPLACRVRTRRAPCLQNTLLRRPVLLAKWWLIANSFAWRCHIANLEVALLLTLE